ncbi:hypothetical protein CALCODRAFT_10918 [Calocera cornea HHB12733]|uniref:Uncharacterized protein n=1 Tax=Calocera cornea HHB12733 TaxID=1353952 RepID=A0A165J6X2_9BASI|nr:hypothetical protein CALCODRAFT_10918 [Calocera cornea HHB12733]
MLPGLGPARHQPPHKLSTCKSIFCTPYLLACCCLAGDLQTTGIGTPHRGMSASTFGSLHFAAGKLSLGPVHGGNLQSITFRAPILNGVPRDEDDLYIPPVSLDGGPVHCPAGLCKASAAGAGPALHLPGCQLSTDLRHLPTLTALPHRLRPCLDQHELSIAAWASAPLAPAQVGMGLPKLQVLGNLLLLVSLCPICSVLLYSATGRRCSAPADVPSGLPPGQVSGDAEDWCSALRSLLCTVLQLPS